MRKGFTLLEVMVALALLAAAFMSLAELGGQALRNHAYARDLSAATLLARGKLAELEEKYDDQGFKDFDEDDEGDFADAGRADVRWKVELVRPDPDLSAERLMGLLAGGDAEADGPGLLASLFGAAPKDAKGGPKADTGAAGAMAAQLLQAQLTAFGEELKKSLRELRLTVSWDDGKPRSFTVVEHLVVLNPRAPGGARGEAPDLPPGLAAQAAPGAAAGAPGSQRQNPVGAPGIPRGGGVR